MTSPAEQEEAVFTHEPIRPVRQDVIGEVVFMAQWKALMDTHLNFEYDIDPPNQMLKKILWEMPGQLTDRHSQVSASMIRWLGTNNGRAFLEEADNMSILMRSREKGYVAAWALNNQRQSSSCYGWRTIEAVLSPVALNDSKVELPTLSLRDAETVETLIGWLGTDKGEQFVVQCRKDIAKLQKAKRDAALEQHLRGSSLHSMNP